MKRIFKLVLGRLKLAAFNIAIALNMLVCALLFNVFALPRETLSGFFGRRLFGQSYVFYYLAIIIDWFYSEDHHCGETAIAEDNMRWELYPYLVFAKPGVDNNAKPVVNSTLH